MKSRTLAVLPLALVFAGCASIVNDTTQPIRIDTVRADGTEVAGANCTMTNDYGSFTAQSGKQSIVRRSGKDLDIVCTHSGEAQAGGRAISRANAGLAGNILLGGGIGAIIDHNKGTAYTYPTWVKLQFGATNVVFDRSDEKEGQPVLAKVPVPVAAK